MKKLILLTALILLIGLMPLASAAAANPWDEICKSWPMKATDWCKAWKEIKKQTTTGTGKAVADITGAAATGISTEEELPDIDSDVLSSLQTTKLTRGNFASDYRKLLHFLVSQEGQTEKQRNDVIASLFLLNYEITRRDHADIVNCGCAEPTTAEGTYTADIEYVEEGSEESSKQTVETGEKLSWKDRIAKIFKRR